MDMKTVRPLAFIAAVTLVAIELAPNEDHKQQHVERIPAIALVSPAPASNVANAAITYSPQTNVASTGFVVPESGLHHICIRVG
ncbi:MAG: hypothetical protein WAM04_01335 [Candidatus Sulfotelmatobacter sp.]|jgi:hypothetical protein